MGRGVLVMRWMNSKYFKRCQAVSELFKRLAVENESRDLEALFNDLVREVLVYSLTSNEEMAPQIQLSVDKVQD